MRRIPCAALLGAALLISGCGDLISLHGLYSVEDDVREPKLVGKWENKHGLFTVERIGGYYEVTLQPKPVGTESTKFEMRLVDVGGVRFADLLPPESVGHMWLRVRLNGDELRVAFFDSEWLRQRLPVELADLVNHRKQAVLTAKTPELRTLVAKYAAEPKAYDDDIVYLRSK